MRVLGANDPTLRIHLRREADSHVYGGLLCCLLELVVEIKVSDDSFDFRADKLVFLDVDELANFHLASVGRSCRRAAALLSFLPGCGFERLFRSGPNSLDSTDELLHRPLSLPFRHLGRLPLLAFEQDILVLFDPLPNNLCLKIDINVSACKVLIFNLSCHFLFFREEGPLFIVLRLLHLLNMLLDLADVLLGSRTRTVLLVHVEVGQREQVLHYVH